MKPSFASFRNVHAARQCHASRRSSGPRLAIAVAAIGFSVCANASVDLVRIPDPTPTSDKHPFARVGDTVFFKIGSEDLKPTRVAPQKEDGKPEFDSLASGYKVNETPATDGTLSITLLKPGTLEIGPIELFDDDKRLDVTNPLTLKVESAIDSSDQKPKEPAPPLPPVSTPIPIELASLIGVGLIAAVALGYLIYRKWKARTKAFVLPEVPAPPPAPEHEIALTRLASLEASHFDQKGEFKHLYFGISEIMKAYLGARYGFDAEESTSRELVEKLEAYSLGSSTVGSVRELYRRLDIVKFTDQTPRLDEPLELFTLARALIRETQRPAVAAATTLPSADGVKP